MRAVIPAKNVKVLATCVHCLYKVGKEVVLECGKNAKGNVLLSLSSMNDSQTAYIAFSFFQTFFERITLENGMHLVVKMTIKSLACVFKMVKATERMTMSVVKQGARHVVKFASQCEGGLLKTHEIHYSETSVVLASFNKKEAKNKLTARTNQFAKALNHIKGCEEVALRASTEGIIFKSHYTYVDKSSIISTLKTSVDIFATELDLIELANEKVPIEIAFSMKEMRALLAFCESVEIVNMAMLFNGGGQPFLFSSDETIFHTEGGEDSAQTFKADLIMATLEAEEIDPAEHEEVHKKQMEMYDAAKAKAERNLEDERTSNAQKHVEEEDDDHIVKSSEAEITARRKKRKR